MLLDSSVLHVYCLWLSMLYIQVALVWVVIRLREAMENVLFSRFSRKGC